jgi:hypothetical protein
MEVIKSLTKWILFFLFVSSPVIYNWVKYEHISTEKEITISIPSITLPVAWKMEEVQSYNLPPGPVYDMGVVLSSPTGGTIYTVKRSKSVFLENKEGQRAQPFIDLSEEEKALAKDELVKIRGQEIKDNPKRIVYKVVKYPSTFWMNGNWAGYMFLFFVIWVASFILCEFLEKRHKLPKSFARFLSIWIFPANN